MNTSPESNLQTGATKSSQKVEGGAQTPYNTINNELDQIGKDLQYVTGRENRRELEERAANLQDAKANHPVTQMIQEETIANYEEGVSFNKKQKGLIEIFKGPYRTTTASQESPELLSLKDVTGLVRGNDLDMARAIRRYGEGMYANTKMSALYDDEDRLAKIGLSGKTTVKEAVDIIFPSKSSE